MVELREGKWDRAALIALLKRAGKNKGNALRAPKSAQRKVRIARELRSRSTATNGWIAERLAGPPHESMQFNHREAIDYGTDPCVTLNLRRQQPS